MNTEKRFGIKKPKAIMLFVQMILTIILLIVSVYLLVFSGVHSLGGWMIASYIAITISVLAIICYAIIGHKKGEIAYMLSILPFLVAIFVNILLPNRNTLQIGLLSLLFAMTSVFMFTQKNVKLAYIVSILMVAISLTFSIYSSITANTQFLGEISTAWPTYVAMYSSIFIPVIMSGTFALAYDIRVRKTK